MDKRTFSRRGALLAVPLLLAACGGGLYIGVDGGDEPPTVSLVASVGTAVPGQAVRLAAAATDDFGVDYVGFYRVDPDGRVTALGNDGVAPFEWDAVVPSVNGSVQFFARAVDGEGQATDSERVTVIVQR